MLYILNIIDLGGGSYSINNLPITPSIFGVLRPKKKFMAAEFVTFPPKKKREEEKNQVNVTEGVTTLGSILRIARLRVAPCADTVAYVLNRRTVLAVYPLFCGTSHGWPPRGRLFADARVPATQVCGCVCVGGVRGMARHGRLGAC